MKQITVTGGGLRAVLCSILLFSSCEKAVVNEKADLMELKKDAVVRVQTRGSMGDDSEYPLRVFAFDDSGTLLDSRSIASKQTELSLHLKQDVPSHIVAVSALPDDYDVPEMPTLQSVIGLKDTGSSQDYLAGTPLEMGFADITPSAGSLTAHIQMGYQVASLGVSLSGLPDECQSVSVSVSPVSGSVSMSGKYDGSHTACLSCTRNDDVWSSGTWYVFPGTGQQTVFTITMVDPEGECLSSITYKSSLSAGVPYSLNGSYSDGSVDVSGEVTTSEWGESVNLSFAFGPELNPVIDGDGNQPVGPTHEDMTQYPIDAIPTGCTIWNEHVVAYVEDRTETTATLVLLSLSDFGDMTSASNEATPGKASGAAHDYVEYGMSGWSIPTADQARTLNEAYLADNLADIIKAAEGDAVVLTDDKGSNVRYLCEDAAKTYTFLSGNKILNAGASAKNYRLRLVRRVRVTVE
ncbi:MAG: hypothetical protein MJY65_07245 [Bacteroidaceae bacterium]|nr:hypothetical protein [Bacteroidaceae bacterium]